MSTTLPQRKSADQSMKESTQQERESLIAAGMQELTYKEAEQAINALGFRLCKDTAQRYGNTGNTFSYLAYNCDYKDIATGISWANVNFGKTEEQRSRVAQLQQIRRGSFGWDGKRIWEL